jgi:hypothetical protein
MRSGKSEITRKVRLVWAFPHPNPDGTPLALNFDFGFCNLTDSVDYHTYIYYRNPRLLKEVVLAEVEPASLQFNKYLYEKYLSMPIRESRTI